jgi:UDP-N-acetylglucosamine acyltransferase
MIGGSSAVTLDIPPYVSAAGNHAKLYGLNLIGLKRRGFGDEAISNIKKAYKIVFRSGMTLEEALKKAEAEMPDSGEVKYFIEFIRSTKRGITRSECRIKAGSRTTKGQSKSAILLICRKSVS